MSSERSDKVEGARPAESSERRPRQSFSDVLKKSTAKPTATGKPAAAAGPLKPPPLPRGPLAKKPLQAATAAGVKLAATETLTKVRSTMHADAQRLQSVRSEGQTAQESKVNHRLLDLIVKELSSEFSGEAQKSPAPAPGAQQHAHGPKTDSTALPTAVAGVSQAGPQPSSNTDAANANTQLKTQAAIALVEKIETFVKSLRPAIAIQVGGGIDARVEVERTGKNEVALKVIGKRGPPAPDDLARIREALNEKGLKLSHLSVG